MNRSIPKDNGMTVVLIACALTFVLMLLASWFTYQVISADVARQAAIALDPNARPPAELWTAMGCSACHDLSEVQSAGNKGQPGPYMGGLDAVAADRVAGENALAYIKTSIVDPNAYVLDGYVANIMPQNFSEKMSASEIEMLAAWILDQNREQ